MNEVEDDDSKILSVNNSSSKLHEERSIEMLAYNSAFPHTTKNHRHLATKQTDTSNKASLVAGKKTKVSIQRVQHHAEMSSLIRNQ